jgi:hypothetical protein
MKRTVLLAVAVLVMLTAQASAQAQKRPDFSGRWVQLEPKEGAGGVQIIKQTETQLIMSHDSEGGGHELVFNLDGTERRSIMRSHDMDIVTVSKAEWKGDRLTITERTTYPPSQFTEPSQFRDQTMEWFINEKGQFIIDVTQSITRQPIRTTRVVHKKG